MVAADRCIDQRKHGKSQAGPAGNQSYIHLKCENEQQGEARKSMEQGRSRGGREQGQAEGHTEAGTGAPTACCCALGAALADPTSVPGAPLAPPPVGPSPSGAGQGLPGATCQMSSGRTLTSVLRMMMLRKADVRCD